MRYMRDVDSKKRSKLVEWVVHIGRHVDKKQLVFHLRNIVHVSDFLLFLEHSFAQKWKEAIVGLAVS